MDRGERPFEAARPAAFVHTVEAVVGALLFALGVVVMVESHRLGAGWTADGPGSGYFPFYIGLILSVSAAAMVTQAIVDGLRRKRVFVDTVCLKRVMSMLLPAVGYVLAIVFLGLYVASALYIAMFMVLLGHYSWTRGIVVAGAVNALLYAMFELWFKVPLYAGTLDPVRSVARLLS
jgi:hypothetical protein